MSSGSLAISSAALATSSAAASRARKAECLSIEKSYDHTTATVEQKQEYASCIKRLYPQEISPECILALKVVIVLVLVAGVWGAFKGYDIADRVMNSILHMIITFLAIIGVTIIIASIGFIFS